jgi:hypothetical protein
MAQATLRRSCELNESLKPCLVLPIANVFSAILQKLSLIRLVMRLDMRHIGRGSITNGPMNPSGIIRNDKERYLSL